MTKQPGGSWTITAPLPPGTYGYKFLVNGSEWLFDPNNPERETVDGIENSVRVSASDESPATVPKISAARVNPSQFFGLESSATGAACEHTAAPARADSGRNPRHEIKLTPADPRRVCRVLPEMPGPQQRPTPISVAVTTLGADAVMAEAHHIAHLVEEFFGLAGDLWDGQSGSHQFRDNRRQLRK